MSQGESPLPSAIVRFVVAMGQVDGAALLEPFTDDVPANDNQPVFRGNRAADRELIGDKVTMSVTDASKHDGAVIVAAEVDGNHDKTDAPDPLILTFYVTRHGDEIATLFIWRNEPAP